MRTKLAPMKAQFLSKFSTSPKPFWIICFFLFSLSGISLSNAQTVTMFTQVKVDLTETNTSPLSFYVSPPLLEIEQIGGGTRNFNIEISNPGQEKIQVKTIFSDISLSTNGKVELNEKGITSYSIIPWLTYKGEQNLILNPSETKKIPFQLKVPRGEKGGRYGAVTFEALPLNIPQGQVALGIRSGTLIYLTIPRTEERKGTIDDISTSSGKEFKISLKNTGNVHCQMEGSLIIKNTEGKVLHRIRFPDDKPTLILPQGKRDFTIPWNKKDPLPEGKYLLEVRISGMAGNRSINLDRKEVEFEVIPQEE